MNHRIVKAFAIVASCLCGAGGQAALGSPLTVNPGLYEITTETLLPNLEESLRYATTRSTRCLHRQDAAVIFPILRQTSFIGCDLSGNQAAGSASNYALVCNNSEAATGSARFVVGAADFRAMLEVKMGGKNMKFSQRVKASRLRACPP